MCYAPVQLKKTPKTLRHQREYRMLKVPCGKCLECKMRRVKSWHVRLMAELKNSTSAHFVTITYDEENIPYSANGLMTLDYTDFQKLMKRIRKSHNGKKIKYYTVGEYGANYARPHFHAIIFNVDIHNLVNNWHHGFVHVGTVTEASIYYTLKYISKGAIQDKVNTDPDDDRQPEKALMSKGIGLEYITEATTRYHKQDVSRPITMLGGQKVALPRYYRDKIFTEGEKIKRTYMFNEYIDEQFNKQLDPLYLQRIRQNLRREKLLINKTD